MSHEEGEKMALIYSVVWNFWSLLKKCSWKMLFICISVFKCTQWCARIKVNSSRPTLPTFGSTGKKNGRQIFCNWVQCRQGNKSVVLTAIAMCVVVSVSTIYTSTWFSELEPKDLWWQRNPRPWFGFQESRVILQRTDPDHGRVHSGRQRRGNYLSGLWPEEDSSSDRILKQLAYTIDIDQGQNNEDNRSMAKAWRHRNSKIEQNKAGYHIYTNKNIIKIEMEKNRIAQKRVFQVARNFHTKQAKIKTIYLQKDAGSISQHVFDTDNKIFLQDECYIKSCRFTSNPAYFDTADVVVFSEFYKPPNPKPRRFRQLWIMHALESPLNTLLHVDNINMFNMTATYRHDSDIVTPYDKWVPYDGIVLNLPHINYAEKKTRQVAWYTSNCYAKNDRLEYALELSEYINVDIYGDCGNKTCSRSDEAACFDLLTKQYKFYLAFENSNCRDYITEKFFVNGLRNNILPIVMGAHPNDYLRSAPKKSYIHVDDFDAPKDLARFLHTLDKNDQLYNEYFRWKGTGEFVDSHFLCRLCAMTHYAHRSDYKSRYYSNVDSWWFGTYVCTVDTWRNVPDIFAPDYNFSKREKFLD